MRYKIGDKVELSRNASYAKDTVPFLEDNNYVFSISKVFPHDLYELCCVNGKHINGAWTQDCMKGLYEEILFDPIESRFEILDL